MPIKKAGRPKKEDTIHHGNNAILKVSLTMPGRSPERFTLDIPNVTGSVIGANRNPDRFWEIIKNAIQVKFPKAK